MCTTIRTDAPSAVVNRTRSKVNKGAVRVSMRDKKGVRACIVKDDTDLPSPFDSNKKITWYLFLSLASRLAKIDCRLNTVDVGPGVRSMRTAFVGMSTPKNQIQKF